MQSHPPRRTYRSLAAALAGANAIPGQEQARSDSAWLAGATLLDAMWTEDAACLRFAGERWLCFRVVDDDVAWTVTDHEPEPGTGAWQRTGDRWLQWDAAAAPVVHAPGNLFAARAGSRCQGLRASDIGPLLYLQGQPILRFDRLRRLDTGKDMLYVGETD